MPRGTQHRLTGLLLASPRGLVLHPDDGGEWLVAPGRRTHPLIGRRVAVEGTRTGFDELWPDRITRC